MASGPGKARADEPALPDQEAKEYTVPLKFDPADNGLSIDNPQLKWQINDKSDIDFDGLKLTQDMLGFSLQQVGRDQAPQKFDTQTSQFVTTMSFRWPDVMSRVGLVTLETWNGKVLWSKQISEDDRASWKSDLGNLPDQMKAHHEKSSFGVIGVTQELFPFLYKGGSFRSCMSKVNTKLEKVRFCSPPFNLIAKGETLALADPKQDPKMIDGSNSSFTINGKQMLKSGIINFKLGTALRIKVTFNNLATIQLFTQPANPELLDVVESSDKKDIILTGTGAKPLARKVEIISQPIKNFWAPTGIPQERVWRYAIQRDTPTLRVLGAFSVPFTLLFNFDRLPKESDRVYVHLSRSSGTYSSSPIIEGYSPGEAEITSKEYSARKVGPHRFEWSFAAPKQGADNRARLLLKNADSDKPWVAHYRQYRSYPFEISMRATGILDADFTFILLGELSAAAWFNSVAGLQSQKLSQQRWGIAARYLKALTAIQSDSGVSVSDFSVLNADLKYNILQGVWHRDEIVGAMLSDEMITVAGLSANMLGGGAYWARTMPKIFNDLFNFVPGLDYPKYVDVELVYFPIALDSKSTAGTTFNLNFHGRVFWTRRLYGEMGFGIREYSFAQPSAANPGKTAAISLATSYGTLGLGLVF